MSPTRRDIFKIAVGLGLTSATPTIAERVDAAQLLDRTIHESPVVDPATFAGEVNGLLMDSLADDWLPAINAEAYGRYVQARNALYDAYPASETGITPVSTFEETVFAMIDEFYLAGIRHGAAFEHLRREAVGNVSTCKRCWGVGIRKTGATCNECRGTGMVATGDQVGWLGPS